MQVNQDEWARLRPAPCDKISIRNLSLRALSATDVWGRKKTQPVQISVALLLKQPFQSAAEGDVLDSSTVHYGHLSKNIESKVHAKTTSGDWLSGYELALLVEDAARSTAAGTPLSAIEIDILYPKASSKGDGIGFLYNKAFGESAEPKAELRAVYVKNIQNSAIIGINSHERNMEQPLIASLWLENLEQPGAVERCNTAVEVLQNVGTNNIFFPAPMTYNMHPVYPRDIIWNLGVPGDQSGLGYYERLYQSIDA